MPGGTYGRGGIAQAKSGPKGSQTAYQTAAKDAMGYFSADETERYNTASSQFTTEGVSSEDRDRARTNIERLRNVASTRAFSEWQEASRYTSDPGARQRNSGNLITAQGFGEQMFGGVNAQQASATTQAISSLQGMADQQTALGVGNFQTTNRGVDQRLYNQNRYGNTFKAGTGPDKGTVDFGTTYIQNAEMAYLGMQGGTNTVYRGGADRESRSSRDLRDDISHGPKGFGHKRDDWYVSSSHRSDFNY